MESDIMRLTVVVARLVIVRLIVRFEGMISLRGDGRFDMVVRGAAVGGRFEAGRVIRCCRDRGIIRCRCS